jgi:5-methylcytosine-specific restriction endonuclease McrA
MTDSALVCSLENALSEGAQNQATVIRHLGEVAGRRLYAVAGFSSMFGYCVQRLGMCEATAVRRIKVAKAAGRFPVLLEAIEAGRIHLTGAALVVPQLTEDNHGWLIEAACGLSRPKLEVLLADLAPKPDLKASMRRKPTARGRAAQEQRSVARPVRPAPRPKPLGGERYGIQFTGSQALVDKLKTAKGLCAPGTDMAALVEEALDLLIAAKEKQKYASDPKTKRKPKPAAAAGTGTRSRHIPAHVRRQVAARDERRCTYQAPDGHRCTETSHLELHHIQAWARGGEHTAKNIQLVCRAHNRLAADRDYGPGLMRERIKLAHRSTFTGDGKSPSPSGRPAPAPAARTPTPATAPVASG